MYRQRGRLPPWLHLSFCAIEPNPTHPTHPNPADTDADVLPPSGTEDLVRPGRFMQCLNVVQAELVQQAEADAEAAAAAEAAGAPVPLPEVGEALLQRLEDVRRDALVVLMDLAGEEGMEYRP